MEAVLHFVIDAKAAEVSDVTVHTAWEDGMRRRHDERSYKLILAGENQWRNAVEATKEDSHFKKVKVTEGGQLERKFVAEDGEKSAILKLWLSYTGDTGVQRFEVSFGESHGFVYHFVIDKKAEFVIYSSDLSSREFRVIPMVPVALNFRLQTATSASGNSYSLTGNCSELKRNDLGMAFERSHQRTPVWSLSPKRILMALYEDKLRLFDEEPLRVQLVTKNSPDSKASTGFMDVELPFECESPTQSYLIKLDEREGQQISVTVFSVAHLELHFTCDIPGVSKLHFRGNCKEFGQGKWTQLAISKYTKITISAAVQEFKYTQDREEKIAKFLKTFDLEDFQFEVSLRDREELQPISCTLSRFEASPEPFSVFELKITESRIDTPRLSIKPVIKEVRSDFEITLRTFGDQVSKEIIKHQVPQLERLGEIKDQSDPQQMHDIWGEDLRGEVRDDSPLKAKSGLQYLKIKRTRHHQESLAGRRIVLKRLSKKYHHRQNKAIELLVKWNKAAFSRRKVTNLQKISRNEAFDKKYKKTLEALAKDIKDGHCCVEDPSLLLREAAAVVRGRAEALILSPRSQEWEKKNWTRHMEAVKPWLQVVEALWRTYFDQAQDFKAAIKEENMFTPAFYSWPLPE